SVPGLAAPAPDDTVNSSAAYGFLADVAVVEVDTATGEVRVRDYVTVHDAGRVLHPALAEGQVLGGLAHGLGAALLERHVYDDAGNLLTTTFVDYPTPTATELPRPTTAMVESPSPVTPLGAKGLGEGTTMSAPAAVANPVADPRGRGALAVGALTRQRMLERSPAAAAIGALADGLPLVGHVATRNRGTVGGSVAHADPAAELPLALLTLGGSVVVEGAGGRREIAADDLFAGFLT